MDIPPFGCAECGTADADTYVVTGPVDDREGRTEVCLRCHDALREMEKPMSDELARELHANGVHTHCPADCLHRWTEDGDDVGEPVEAGFTPHEAHEHVHRAAGEQAELICRLVENCGGSGVHAVLAVARAVDVGVLWEDRMTIENRLEVAFTDEQWARIAVHLEDFDEWTDAGGTWEGRRGFAEWVVYRADLQLIEHDDGEVEVVDTGTPVDDDPPCASPATSTGQPCGWPAGRSGSHQ